MWDNIEGKYIEKDENSVKVKEKGFIRNLRINSQRGLKAQNLKKKQMIEEREFQIFKENQILLKKMMKIDANSPKLLRHRNGTSKDSMKSRSYVKKQSKIFEENQQMLKRLRSASSNYSAAKFERENKYNQVLKSRITKKVPKKNKFHIKEDKSDDSQIIIDKILERVKLRNQN